MKIKRSNQPGQVVVKLGPQDEHLLDPAAAATARPRFRLERLLVPIDFSDCSRKALAYAVPFAEQFQSALILLYVVQLNYVVGEFGAIDFPVVESEVRANAEKELARLAQQQIGEQWPTQTLVRVGRPVQEIVTVAREKDVDLIVMATHGHTGLKHILLGSVTENVVRYAPCPVLVVREQEHEFVAPASSATA
jgi:nucleotide-binding universal stress UspA family protein